MLHLPDILGRIGDWNNAKLLDEADDGVMRCLEKALSLPSFSLVTHTWHAIASDVMANVPTDTTRWVFFSRRNPHHHAGKVSIVMALPPLSWASGFRSSQVGNNINKGQK